MDSVFSFGGVTDVDMHVYVTGITRPAKPGKRQVQTIIAGRSGVYETTANDYEQSEVIFDCMYTGAHPAEFARELAYWLDGSNDLILADEPDKIYTATAWAAIPEDYVMSLRHFTITFSCYPLARSAAKQQSATVSLSGGGLIVAVSGTAPTPCRVIITNNGTTTIHELKITHSVIA